MTSEFTRALRGAVTEGLARMQVLHGLVAGTVPRETLVRLARRYYAELRAFLDVKLPERMRLCPYEATMAKELFARAYIEEQGRFVPGADHAGLFKRVCDALGISTAALERETESYATRFRYMRALEASPEAMVRELAITFAWESAAPAVGTKLATGLVTHYGLSADAVEFFGVHEEIDRKHSAAAEHVLVAYATSVDLRRLALGSVGDALDLERALGMERA